MWESFSSSWATSRPASGDGDSDVSFIGEVDCAAHRSMCDEFGIEGLPTFLYGDPLMKGEMDQYAGDKTVKNLKRFAEKKLKPICSANNVAACDDKARGEIRRLMGLGLAEVESLIQEQEDKRVKVENDFDEGFENMQKKYDELALAKENDLAKIKRIIGMARRTQKWREAHG